MPWHREVRRLPQAAQAVLLDSDFGHMPDVVAQGRQVVNNIQRSASLFLVKNIFSLLMALFSAVFAITYPLEPSQISLISMFTIGVPGFLLALEPNRERIRGHFMTNVMLRALPAGITDALAVGALVTCGEVFRIPGTDIATASTMLLSAVGFMILIKISQPFNKAKYAIVIGNILRPDLLRHFPGTAVCHQCHVPDLRAADDRVHLCGRISVPLSDHSGRKSKQKA